MLDFVCPVVTLCVQGSERPMGLFTYDVSLEMVTMPESDSLPATPPQGPSCRGRAGDQPMSQQVSSAGSGPNPLTKNGVSPTTDTQSLSSQLIVVQQDTQTFSMSTYENEFLEHPDLANTWAVDGAFLERFAEGFAAYRAGRWTDAREILEETRKARRTADGRKVRAAAVHRSEEHPVSQVGCRVNDHGKRAASQEKEAHHRFMQVLDGPSCTLLDFMQAQQFQVPEGWKGYRELTEK